MRIVGGKLSGRALKAPDSTATRPTSDRVREAVFNILAHHDWGDLGDVLSGTVVCDAFAGSGALGFEALSRGAAKIWLLEKDPTAYRALQENAKQFGVFDACHILFEDALDPPPAAQTCTLLFLDPPYKKNLIPQALTALAKTGWLAQPALIVAEAARSEKISLSPDCELLLSRIYGDTAVHFIRR